MRSLLVILMACAICFTSANKLDDANSFMDDVLSVYVPWSVKTSGLEVYEMPNFSFNFQERGNDGSAIDTKVIHHSGNLTGLQLVQRRSCQEPSWSFGNISVVCNIVLPKLEVKYEARFQEATGHTTYVRFRQHEYGVTVVVADVEAKIEVTSSPHLKVPTIKNIALVNQGKPTIQYGIEADISFETLSTHFFHKYEVLFKDIFLGPYKSALEKAVESVSYPKET